MNRFSFNWYVMNGLCHMLWSIFILTGTLMCIQCVSVEKETVQWFSWFECNW